jgi:hypothetical protein
MPSNQQDIWYALKQYTHPSWLSDFKQAPLKSGSSSLLWNLAYVDLCSCFSLDIHITDSVTENDFVALASFVELKEKLFTLMSLCLDTSQNSHSHDSDSLLFCSQLSQALSIRDRFEKYRAFFGENSERVLVDFLCYAFFKKKYPNISSRIKIQLSTDYANKFDKLVAKLSEFDIRSIAHLYISLVNYLQEKI